MTRKVSLFVLVILSYFVTQAEGQFTRPKDEAFLNATRSKTWKVTKYLFTSDQVTKTSLFANLIFNFNLDDSTTFLVEGNGNKRAVGTWTPQNGASILFSIPLGNESETGYNEAVRLLCAWPLQKMEMQPSLLKFKMLDPLRGEVLIELSQM